MRWGDYHLHEFGIGGERYGDPRQWQDDFGGDWWHQINVEAVEDKVPRDRFPKVTKKAGKSPTQYADKDE